MNKTFEYNFSKWHPYIHIHEKDGIYTLHNLNNDKRYIGYSCRMQNRIRSHIYSLKSGRHAIPTLQSDFNQGDFFEIEILCELENGNYMNHLLIEKYFILKHNSVDNGYNRSYNSYDKNRALKDIRHNMRYIMENVAVTLL
ncbi:GIY-YIG nuclease family protein [Enterocloster asparagiformis]|uniref:GIY-YIG nuclease family protein n=1 Tax=Enterocloster asparagiformis TaxID=333367 RepID=UPI002A81FC60|nr:GIY-YIG nuclease family protein [Enterocloster asparagiformis]